MCTVHENMAKILPSIHRGNTAHSDAELYDLMFDMNRLLKKHMAQEGSGLSTYLHMETLRFIEEQGMSDMQAIAEYLRVASPSATRLIGTLVTDGLAERVPDAHDRRRVLITITSRGKKYLTDAAERRTRTYARLIEPLSEKERKDFAHILRTITRVSY